MRSITIFDPVELDHGLLHVLAGIESRWGTVTAEPRVAAVVLNYNGRELLAEYLPSILESNYENLRVIVVDNASTDDSVTFLRSEFPSVDVVENDENVGFSRGNNVGASHAPDAEYLWFLNTDVEVRPDALSTLVEYVDDEPDTGIVVPRIHYADDPEVIQSVGYDLGVSWTPSPRDHEQRSPSNSDPHPVTYGSGSALLVDRDVWEEIGGFDDENFIFGDDTYLCYRAWMQGHRVEVVPDSVVYHELGSSRSAIPATVAYHAGRSKTRSYLKLLEPASILRGLPGFLLTAIKVAACDVYLRSSPKSACYRLLGYVSALREVPALYAARERIQRERTTDDATIVSTGPTTE